MHPDLVRLIKYVDAATDLAESIQQDMGTKQRKISSETVAKLGKFIQTAESFQKVIAEIQKSRHNLN